MNLFQRCLCKELGKEEYKKCIELFQMERETVRVKKDEINVEENRIFHQMYQTMKKKDQQDIKMRIDRMTDTLFRAFGLGKQFAIATVVYIASCAFLICLNLNETVTAVSLILMGICFFYKLYEYVSNKICFVDVYLFMVYKAVLDKINESYSALGR